MSNLVILDFLTNQAGLDLLTAAPLVQKFDSAGYNTQESLWSLDSKAIKSLVPDASAKKKIQALIRKGPNSVAEKITKKKTTVAPKTLKDDSSSLLPPKEVVDDKICGVIKVNRSPVMILWTAVLAYTAEYEWDESLSLASVLAALNAKAKATSIWGESSSQDQDVKNLFGYEPEVKDIVLLGREVPACRVLGRIRGCLEGQPVHPKSAHDRLQHAFPGEAYAAAFTAMRRLARGLGAAAARAGPESRRGYALYEAFRPAVPGGAAGWGAAGNLDLALILRLAGPDPAPPAAPPASGAAAAVKQEAAAETRGGEAAEARGEGQGGAPGGSGGEEWDCAGVLAAVARAGPEGLPLEALAVGGRGAAEEAQVEGLVYARGGRLFAL